MRCVTDGRVHTSLDVRFGRESMPTREGNFRVFASDRDGIAALFDQVSIGDRGVVYWP